MQRGKVILVLFIYSFSLGSYLFYKGYQSGWQEYKHSKNMQMALDAAYRYGKWQCEDEHGLTK